MSAQFETPIQVVVVDQKSIDSVIVETQPETQPTTQKKEVKMTKKTKKLIVLCGKFYGFDGEEAIARLANNEKPKKEKKAKEPRKRKSVASNPEDGEKKKRGRPNKTVKVVEESQVVDMFADIVSKDDVASQEQHVEIELENLVEIPLETHVESKKVKKTKVVSEEEKQAKEAKKAQEKAEKEAEKEAKKAQEKAEKEAEKEAKKAQEKAEKEAKKAQEKALKEAEKEAKKAEKPAKKSKAKTEKKAPASVASTPVVSDAELEAEVESDQESEEPEQEVFKVKKFEHKGVSYLRTRNGDNWHDNGHIYNMDQDLVGFWNEQNQDINFVEEGECAEEEYDE
jgi:hypothetical protein